MAKRTFRRRAAVREAAAGLHARGRDDDAASRQRSAVPRRCR